jgi:iron complex outermembrane receptor protein
MTKPGAFGLFCIEMLVVQPAVMAFRRLKVDRSGGMTDLATIFSVITQPTVVMKFLTTLTLLLGCTLSLFAQSASLQGQLQDPEQGAVVFANVALYSAADTALVKVETSDEAGVFRMQNIPAGDYFLIATYVGLPDLQRNGISLTNGQQLDLGVLAFANAAIELETATVTASRAMVEVKPDRTVFNVEGTINSVGSNAIELLRKAPGVTVDNNDNVNVLGRAGVLLYVDGKRLPLTGDDLSNYLQNLPADQIDRIDIITNPGARYEAEGNAGIIDIRLKKNENFGANGSANLTASQGVYTQGNAGLTGNFRNKMMNVFATVGGAQGQSFNKMWFDNNQNNLFLSESSRSNSNWNNFNYRLGTDFFLSEKHTLGFLVSGRMNQGDNQSDSRTAIAAASAPSQVDSMLIAQNVNEDERTGQTYNINYRFTGDNDRSLNVDLDYGQYRNDSYRFQPNRYFTADGNTLLTEIINTFDTPTDIDIYTAKVDYEQELLGGKLGFGSKLSRVVSDNTFLFFDQISGNDIRNDQFSNRFNYEENVYAGYLNFARDISETVSFSAGVRAEQTDATGDLRAFIPELQEPPVELNYLNWFPSAGITWQVAPMHMLALNYGRRINRPDYNVLNPFNNRLSELTYEKGNPFLTPEIVNNIELGYTLKYRYNFKLGYSKTTDQITRLIAPDETDPRAGFITWANLASQTLVSFNISAPLQVTKGWNAYFNVNAAYLDNQADYGEGAVVDVQAFTYNFYTQQTFDLPAGFKGEVSGWFAGPGVWGGVFEYESQWSLNLGLQRRFFNEQLNVRLSANDIFYESGWDGMSSFNGLVSEGRGRWDSRRVSVSLSYNFGNQKVQSRKRQTGLEEEAGRVGEGS